MTTVSKILVKNIVFAIVFLSGFFILGVTGLKTYVDHQHDTHRQQILSHAENFTGEQANEFSQLLMKSYEYDSLEVKDASGKVVDSYDRKPVNYAYLATLIHAEKPIQVNAKPLQARVLYTLNQDHLFSWFNALSLFILAVTIFMVIAGTLLTSKMTTIANNKASEKIAQAIADEIKLAIDNQQDIEQFQLPSAFSEVNRVIQQLKEFIATKLTSTEALKQTAYVDPLTGLSNRNSFAEFFNAYAKHTRGSGFGVLFITRCTELRVINKVHGYQEGDRYLCQVANILRKQIQNVEGASLFRLNGSDFATFIPNVTLKASQSYADELTGLFNEYQVLADIDSVAYTGIVNFEVQRPLGELLALADTAISIAETKHKNSWYIQSYEEMEQSAAVGYGSQSWGKEIDYVIEHQNVSLLTQLIQPNARNNKIYHEVLARFTNTSGEQMPTASFIAMAEKLDKIILIDRLVIEKVLSEIRNKNLTEQSFGINLSSRSIHDEHFMIWLERRLLRDKDICSRLVFEVSEFGLQQNVKDSIYFINMVHRAGAKVCVEHFGVGITSFKFFRELSPDYVKMDGSYTRDIENDKNNQYFLRLMIDLAHRMSIKVLAEGVETQEEKHAFDEILVDGCQGYYIGKPEGI
ncbi:EAL domain-containing protein [Thalassotalea mangrovi]|uniref:EAL domain-containing protein n=1 Tax=Thalassotalea mangrovi TaxID=2572245 RepID=A0A4U1B2Z6_9GAMM|nr:EAL domain-containing protein [Thalassotalea mangrovi]TKB43625.1 EAL domain-containing protein [Thalassotalea mangrovi]